MTALQLQLPNTVTRKASKTVMCTVRCQVLNIFFLKKERKKKEKKEKEEKEKRKKRKKQKSIHIHVHYQQLKDTIHP